MKGWKLAIPIIIILAVVAVVATLSSGSSNAARRASATEAAGLAAISRLQHPPLALLDWKWETGEYSRYLTGRLKNNSDKDYSYVQIRISLTDADKNVVGSTMDNVSGLEAGQIWKFKALVMEDSATGATIIDFTGN